MSSRLAEQSTGQAITDTVPGTSAVRSAGSSSGPIRLDWADSAIIAARLLPRPLRMNGVPHYDAWPRSWLILRADNSDFARNPAAGLSAISST
jgi:hypothetical protein